MGILKRLFGGSGSKDETVAENQLGDGCATIPVRSPREEGPLDVRRRPIVTCDPPENALWLCCDGTVDVVGESYRLNAFDELCGRISSGQRVEVIVPATLVREPTNQHDRNAVAVMVDGRHVGYLSRDEAPAWHSIIDDAAARGLSPTCWARISGGYSVSDRRGIFGVSLFIAEPHRSTIAQPSAGALVLPPYRRVTVTHEEHYQETLLAVLGRRTEAIVFAELELVDTNPHRKKVEPAVQVSIGGSVVGYLTTAMTERYRPVVERATSSGRRAACQAEIAPTTRGGRMLADVTLLVEHPDYF